MRCVLVGNFGVGNLGDEALKEYFLQTFSDVDWIVLEACPVQPYEVPRLPLGFRSLFRPWWKTLSAYRHADAVVFGGGSLFTDVESVYACLLWWWHAFAAHLFRKPVFLAFQGIGPFRTSLGKRLARWAVQHAAFVSVRDESSFQRVQSWNLNKQIVQTFDPLYEVFSMTNVNIVESNTIVLIPRSNSGESFLIEACKVIQEHQGDPVRIVLMQPDHERFIIERIASLAHGRSSVVAATSTAQLMQAISDALLVVAERYHGALAAHALGIPVVVCPQSDGDKLSALPLSSQKSTLIASVQTGERSLREALLAL